MATNQYTSGGGASMNLFSSFQPNPPEDYGPRATIPAQGRGGAQLDFTPSDDEKVNEVLRLVVDKGLATFNTRSLKGKNAVVNMMMTGTFSTKTNPNPSADKYVKKIRENEYVMKVLNRLNSKSFEVVSANNNPGALLTFKKVNGKWSITYEKYGNYGANDYREKII